MEPIAWTGTHKFAAAGISVGSAFMGIATDQWIVIASGLAIGVMARSAYLLSLSKPVWRDLLISLIVAPMNGALAAELVDSLQLHDSRLLLATALLGSSSTMAFMGARRQFLRWHGADHTPAQVFADPDTTTHVPKGTKGADVTAVGPESPQTPWQVEVAELRNTPPVADESGDLAALLRKLDEGE